MRLALALIAATALALGAPSALAAPAVEGTFDLPAASKRLALGPDGNIWVTHDPTGDNEEVSRVTPDGTVTSFDVTPNAVGGVVGGPDGNVWITHTGGVVKIPPDNPETGATQHNVTGLANPQGITVGPDGNLWAAGGTFVVRIPPGDPTNGSQDFNNVLTGAATTANGIVAGTDGRIWVADQQGKAVVSVTTDGGFAPHPMPDVTGDDGAPQDVAAGPNGQILYTNPTTLPNTVGRLFDDTIPVPTEVPLTDPFGAVFANDGAYWIAQFNGKNLGRMMPDGSYTTFGDFSNGNHFPRNVAKGAGNDLWVILDNPGNPSKIARISGVEPPPPPGGGGTPATPATPITPNAQPSVSGVSMASAFSVGTRRTPISNLSAVGTRIRFTLSEAATVRLTFQRVLPGRRRGRRCVAPRRTNLRARRCTRYVRAGVLRRKGVAGRNVVPFTGRIGRRPLRLGRHRLLIDATDAAGSRAATRSKRFRIVPRRRARR